MTSTSTALNSRVQAKRSELTDAKRRVEILAAELRAWEEALQIVAPAQAPLPYAASGFPRTSNGSDVIPSKTSRGMKGSWRAIMQAVATLYPERFSLDDLEQAAAAADSPVNRNTARSQMTNYAKAGLIERIKQGQFRMTEAGLIAAGALSQLHAPQVSEAIEHGPEVKAA